MRIESFLIEDWMNAHEESASVNLAETCVSPMSLTDLFELTETPPGDFFGKVAERRLTYGAIDGSDTLKEGICGFYANMPPGAVLTTHGAAGANHLVFCSLVEPGDEVICVHPTYQQLYSIPASFGATVKLLELRRENRYRIDPDELRSLVNPRTRMICINNPNNPTGALNRADILEKVVDAARECGAVLLSDEVYRGLQPQDIPVPSAADIYERAVSVCSMSKVFSLAGLRLGWLACRDETLMEKIRSHRNYSHISCGVIDEAVAALALSFRERVLERSRGIIRTNLAAVEQLVDSHPLLSWVKPEAGTTALLWYRADIGSYELCERLLADTGVLLSPGACFGLEGCVRIGFVFARGELQRGLELFGSFLSEVAGQ